jgi:hypothetical protein
MTAAYRDNFHLLILSSHHPVLSNWLVCLLLKLCLHGICAWGDCVPRPMWEGQRTTLSSWLSPPPFHGLWGVHERPSGLCCKSLTYWVIWPSLSASIIEESGNSLGIQVCRGETALSLASVTSKPERMVHWCPWQLSQDVRAPSLTLDACQLVSSVLLHLLLTPARKHGESKYIFVYVGSLLVHHNCNICGRHNSAHTRRGKLSLFKEKPKQYQLKG